MYIPQNKQKKMMKLFSSPKLKKSKQKSNEYFVSSEMLQRMKMCLCNKMKL